MFHLATRCCVVVPNARASTSYANTNNTSPTTKTYRCRRYHHHHHHHHHHNRTRRRNNVVNAVNADGDKIKDAWRRLQNDYASWRAMNNIIAPNVEVAYVGGGGEDGNDLYRGVKATADIRSEDDLVRLPRAACMLVIEGQENPHEEYISNELWAKAGDERWALRVALVLLYEKSLGRQ